MIQRLAKHTPLLLITLYVFSLLQIFILQAHAKQDNVLIYIRDDVYEDYLQFVNNRDIDTIDNFSGKTIRRDVVDMIIAQQALKLGGFDHQFSYAPGKVNFRNTKMLQEGKLLISLDSYWQKDALAIEDKVYISAPVLKTGSMLQEFTLAQKIQGFLVLKALMTYLN
ncbi:hypothetical protein [Colwellia sp. RSH04]|uniref:hypothetical protein n=1 Tax=Colwellia sp. RSH04 TaxID=2305464 RepID=UPI0021750465|nr:hypothetical protein [Colwellia sp. RSH04]